MDFEEDEPITSVESRAPLKTEDDWRSIHRRARACLDGKRLAYTQNDIEFFCRLALEYEHMARAFAKHFVGETDKGAR